MAAISGFSIRNFKGAAKVELHFANRSATPVLTLVGLNESGKTTILEALSYAAGGDNAVSSLFKGSVPRGVEALIPIHRKANFTGTIEIVSTFDLFDDDILHVERELDKKGVTIDPSSLPRKLNVTRTYTFQDSVVSKAMNLWGFTVNAKLKSARKFKKYEADSPPIKEELNVWLAVVDAIEDRFPRVAYFPTFLVDLPEKIYLKAHEKELPVNRYYREVIQDVLNSLNENLSLETHVCDRIEAFRTKDATANWWSVLWSGPSKAPIDAVFQKLSDAVTREVLGSWENVFGRKISAKSISVEWHIDTEKQNLPYATFRISDGASKYAINERSLGFRWFFSFLLFTTFKRQASRSTVFVFDEPAANLHAKAQAELLKSFGRITLGENKIVYSTHSHHMINPHWLSGAYIVENTAIDHDGDDTFGLVTKPTNVVATPYRAFVSNNPNRVSYFQPVIEQLEYITPEIVGSSPFLIVEGITDYYALKSVYGPKESYPFSLMPGVGAGASGPLISSMLGRGERFLILLDDDVAGRQAKERYSKEWFLGDQNVITLKSVGETFIGAKLESLISAGSKAAIAERIGKAAPSKKEIGWYLAESCADPQADKLFDQETTSKLRAVLELAKGAFAK
ncbi:AAA family ATPase [Tardiphaga sp. 285_C5_N1_2]|uniref:AAA family ATPase n=1 Tax=Tardiphaga sp. 285_C5_N1_2 TaxID=3240775 RepID=UPI003F8A470E